MTDETAPTSPEHLFGDAVVIVDNYTTQRPAGSVEFNFRVKRLGLVRVYRVEVDQSHIFGMTPRHVAEFLLRHARHKSLLFAYRDS